MDKVDPLSASMNSMIDEIIRSVNAIDLEQPRTSAQGLAEAVQSGVSEMTASAAALAPDQASLCMREAFTGGAVTNSLRERWRADEDRALNDPVAARLLEIFSDVSSSDRYRPFMVMRHAIRPSFVARQLQGLSAINGLGALSGEKRAIRTMSAIGDIGAVLYEPYTRGLLSLLKFAYGNGKEVPADLKFGALINEIEAQFSRHASQVFERDAAWLRNADAHANWSYDSGTGTIVAWDIHMPKTSFPLRNLSSLATKLFYVSGPALYIALQVHLQRTVYHDVGIATGMLELMPLLVNGSGEQRSEAQSRLSPYVAAFKATEAVFAELTSTD